MNIAYFKMKKESYFFLLHHYKNSQENLLLTRGMKHVKFYYRVCCNILKKQNDFHKNYFFYRFKNKLRGKIYIKTILRARVGEIMTHKISNRLTEKPNTFCDTKTQISI